MKFNLEKFIYETYYEKNYKSDKFWNVARKKEEKFLDKLSEELKKEYEGLQIVWGSQEENDKKELIALTLQIVRSIYGI